MITLFRYAAIPGHIAVRIVTDSIRIVQSAATGASQKSLTEKEKDEIVKSIKSRFAVNFKVYTQEEFGKTSQDEILGQLSKISEESHVSLDKDSIETAVSKLKTDPKRFSRFGGKPHKPRSSTQQMLRSRLKKKV